MAVNVEPEHCRISIRTRKRKVIFPDTIHFNRSQTWQYRAERAAHNGTKLRTHQSIYDRKIRLRLITPRLLQRPLSVVVLRNPHGSLLVQTNASSVEYRGGQDCIGDGRQALDIKIAWMSDSRVHATCGVNEFLNGYVSVSPLAIKVTGFGRRVLHAEQASEQKEIYNPTPRERKNCLGVDAIDKGVHALERVVPGFAGVIDGRVVPPVCLVNVDIALHSNRCFASFSRKWSEGDPG
jgi:hypothetical protein